MVRKFNYLFFIWVVYFCYSTCAALIFQKVILPLMPSLHAGNGLMIHDSIYFHTVATKLAEEINNFGWRRWSLFSANGATGNVAILGALYAIFGHDPAVIIPINAAFHALSGVIILLLVYEITSNKIVAIFAGIISASIFIVSPSSLTWYGQVHKDSYFIFGILSILLVWLKSINNREGCNFVTLSMWNFLGVLLVGCVRPYVLKLLVIVASLFLLDILITSIFRKNTKIKENIAFFLVVLLTLIVSIQIFQKQAHTNNYNYSYSEAIGEAYSTANFDGEWVWEGTEWLPKNIDHYFETAAKTRVGLIAYGVNIGAGSMVDVDIKPNSVVGMLNYIPRAIHLAAFSPFPSVWLEKTNIAHLIVLGEMVVYYICVSGLFFLLIFNRNKSTYMVLLFCLFFLAVYGYTQANVGTLYRHRYAFTSLLMTLGLTGWLTWLSQNRYLDLFKKFYKKRVSEEGNGLDLVDLSHDFGNRKKTILSSFVILCLTLLVFLGFFLRDILMAKLLGIGVSVDGFFIALLIPMFFVSVFCMPLGMAIIPIYLEINQKSSRYSNIFVIVVSIWVSAVLAGICIFLYFALPSFLKFLYPELSNIRVSELSALSRLALPILLFSGVLILCNSVLQAHGRSIAASLGQLMVPVTTIAVLLLFGNDVDIKFVIVAMVLGQIINLIFVNYLLSLQGFSIFIWYKGLDNQLLISLVKQYIPLVISAFFVGITATAATFLAVKLPAGSVSVFNFGSKVVLFITGLANVVISAVILPYFSMLIVKRKLFSARRELSFFLILLTFISVPISSLLYVFSEDIVKLIFSQSTFDGYVIDEIAQVMRYAVIQIPFFICNNILLKFAIASKHSVTIFISAVVGLVVSVTSATYLIESLGVAAISLGVSMGVVVSTLLLLSCLLLYKHLSVLDSVVVFINFLLFITLLVSVDFRSGPNVVCTLIGYISLVFMYGVFCKRNDGREQVLFNY